VIAAGGRDHAGRWDLAGQQICEGAAALERTGMLQELELEDDRPGREAEIRGIDLDRGRRVGSGQRLGRRVGLVRFGRLG